MIAGKRILAVVPARGGSKGVPGKNIRPVMGLPLIAYTARAVAGCGFIDRAVVSTDSDEIAAVARRHGLEAPFLRPEAISGDRIADWDVLVHALREMESRDGVAYDVVLMLQPTSPLRDRTVLEEVATKVVAEGLDSVWTVSPTDLKFHPLKQLRIADGRMGYFDPRGRGIIARQQLEPVYHRNGVAYAITRGCLLDQGNIMGEKAGAVVVNGPTVNIDNLADFEAFEKLLAAGTAGAA